MSLIPLEEAQTRLLNLAKQVPVTEYPLSAAIGRFSAEDIYANRDQPSSDLSAMDGYAVRYDDLPGPWTLVGESRAGQPYDDEMKKGEAVRISTGAVFPDSADTVIIRENVRVSDDRISLSSESPISKGQHIRRKAMDFRSGACIIERGAEMTPACIAATIMADHSVISAARPLKIAILDNGDELAEPGEKLAHGDIPATNGIMLESMLNNFRADITRPLPIKDNLASVTAAIAAHKDADIICTSGGASVGDHDLIQPALQELGAKLDFWRVAMKPGKPLMAGTLGKSIILGLPGNPVSAYVTAHLFLLPLVKHMSGARDIYPGTLSTTSETMLPETGSRAEFLRGYFDGKTVRALGNQDSSALMILSQANALIMRGAYSAEVDAGAAVEIQLLP